MDFDKLIQINRSWTSQELVHHFKEVKGKVNIKLYTVKVTGTQILPDSIVSTLHQMLPDYVYGKRKIAEIGERNAGLTANHFFGRRNPNTEGKYGELLLFALVESVLGCKMISHKIKTLTNMSEQVKGGDGIFIGEYEIADGRKQMAYLIGESKIMSQYSAALGDSLDSLNRFHGIVKSPEFRNTELLVAKENLMLDDTMDVDELYDRLNPNSELYKSQLLVHPVLLMYNEASMQLSELNSATQMELEESIKTDILAKKDRIVASINSKLELYPDIAKVYLDFFLIPFNDVSKFRDTMYYHIHGIPYS